MASTVPLARDAAPFLSALAWAVPLLLITVAWWPSSDPLPLPVQILFTVFGVGLFVLFWLLPRRLG